MGFNIRFSRGRAYFKIPRQIPYPITVSYGQPMKSNANHNEVRREVVTLEQMLVAKKRKNFHYRKALLDQEEPEVEWPF